MIFSDIHRNRVTDLAHVGRAGNAGGRFAGLLQSGEQDGNQKRDDSNDDKQFDERESAGLFAA